MLDTAVVLALLVAANSSAVDNLATSRGYN